MLCHIRPTGKGIMLHPSAIPVFVDDDTETGIETIVYDFLDSFHPDRIYGHILLIRKMSSHPGCRNAKTVESLLFQTPDIALSSLIILP